MKIFDISASKTGTTSLAQAMQILGYRSSHGCPPAYANDYVDKVTHGRFDFKVVADHDFIGNLLNYFYFDLERLYPGSKYIFLWRDEQEWLCSTLNQLKKNPLENTKTLTPAVINRLLNINCLTTADQDFLLKKYRLHREGVLEHFKDSKNLLIMDIHEGWTPLCQFFGKPLPTESFPHLNVS